MTRADTDILDTPEAGPAAIKGGVVRVAGYLGGTLLSVASAAALLRYLGVADFGRYATVLSLVTIVAGLTEAGMTSVGVREWSIRDSDESRAMLRSLLGLRLVLTGAGIVLAVAFAYAVGYPRTLILGTALWGLGIVVQMAALTLGIPLQSALRLGWVSALDLLRQTVTVALILLLILAGSSLLPLLSVPVPAALASVAATLVLVRGTGTPLLPSFDRARWTELLRITLPFAAASAVGTVYVYVSQVIMSLAASARETGIFGASFRIFIVLVTIPALMATAALPILARAARDDEARLKYAGSRLQDVCVVLGVAAGLGLAASAPIVIDVVAGGGYEASVDVLRIHAVALGFSFLAAAGGYLLISTHRHWPLMSANAVALIVSAGLTLWLGTSIGARGAALANVAGEATLALGYGIALARAGLRPSAGTAAKVLVAALPGVAAVLLLPALPATVLAVGSFAGLLALVGGLPPESRELISWRARGSTTD